jgi:hypothetical protein
MDTGFLLTCFSAQPPAACSTESACPFYFCERGDRRYLRNPDILAV